MDGTARATIPMDFHLQLICDPRGASQFGDLRLAE